MRWNNLKDSYDELFPRVIEEPKAIIETPTGTREEEHEEVIHETIIEEKPTEKQEEPKKAESGTDDGADIIND